VPPPYLASLQKVSPSIITLAVPVEAVVTFLAALACLAAGASSPQLDIPYLS
jgi:hypothetical protein